jgi:hypothetical protein
VFKCSTGRTQGLGQVLYYSAQLGNTKIMLGVAQVVKRLPRKGETLSSNSSTAKKEKKKKCSKLIHKLILCIQLK